MDIDDVLRWHAEFAQDAYAYELKALGLEEAESFANYQQALSDSPKLTAFRDMAFLQGLSGDHGMLAAYIRSLSRDLLTGRSDALAEAMIAFLLHRMSSDNRFLSELLGTRGAPRKGDRAIRLAGAVVTELRGGCSVEDAWAAVAARFNVSESTVKLSWIERKVQLKEKYAEGVKQLLPDASEEQVAAILSEVGFRRDN